MQSDPEADIRPGECSVLLPGRGEGAQEGNREIWKPNDRELEKVVELGRQTEGIRDSERERERERECGSGSISDESPGQKGLARKSHFLFKGGL